MKNNLIPFPTTRPSESNVESGLACDDELKELRAAFDRARADWPFELAELTENNKIFSGSKK